MSQINPRFGFQVRLMTWEQFLNMVDKGEDLLIFMNDTYGGCFPSAHMAKWAAPGNFINFYSYLDLSSIGNVYYTPEEFFSMIKIKIYPFLKFESNSSDVVTYNTDSPAVSILAPQVMKNNNNLIFYMNKVGLHFSIDGFIYLAVPLECLDREDTLENEKILFQALPSFSVRAIAVPSRKTSGAKMAILEDYGEINNHSTLTIPSSSTSTASGLVLRSSNGSSYLLSIDDSGNLQTTQVST